MRNDSEEGKGGEETKVIASLRLYEREVMNAFDVISWLRSGCKEERRSIEVVDECNGSKQ